MTTASPPTSFYWQGAWTDEDEASRLVTLLTRDPDSPPLRTDTVVRACELLRLALRAPSSPSYRTLHRELTGSDRLSPADADRALGDLSEALDPAHLRTQVLAELGPPASAGCHGGSQTEETWYPVGTLVHIAPSNVPIAGILTAVEGLLAGNLNIVKVSGNSSLFTHLAASMLASLDLTGRIRQNLIVLRFPSADTDWLKAVCRPADAIAVWGTEETVASLARHASPGSRVVDWGPKLSLAYIDCPEAVTARELHALAHDVLRNGQRSCTSPQIMYVNTDDHDVLFAIAQTLGQALGAVQGRYPPAEASDAEKAEITNVVTVARLEEHLGLTRVVSEPGGRWNVLADTRPTPEASPLYGTIWVKPLPREAIHTVLHPMRRYLQTIGLHARPDSARTLADTFFQAGALRITPLGDMLSSYPGEPHDGVFALQRYSRRVSRRTSTTAGSQ